MQADPTGQAENKKPTLYKGLSEISKVQGQVDWPLPRMTWREEVQDSYEAYKNDISARVARQVDVTMVIRYFDLQELIARVFDELITLPELITTNNAGSQASHPHLGTFARLSGAAIKLANEIGATPMARVKLGLYATEGAAAQAALEKAVNADPVVKRAAPKGVDVDMDVVEGEIVMSW